MKRHILNLSKTVMATVLAGLASACILAAADAPPAGPPAGAPAPGGPPDRGRGGPGGRGGFGLDDQQRQLFREAMQKNQEAMAKLDEKLRAAQKELVQATLAEKYDEAVVREKADAVAKIQADMTVLRCKALSTVAPTLKPEQRQELENSRFGAAMLTGGMMDFGGPRFGDRGGDPAGFRGRGGGPGGDPGGLRGRDRGPDQRRPDRPPR